MNFRQKENFKQWKSEGSNESLNIMRDNIKKIL